MKRGTSILLTIVEVVLGVVLGWRIGTGQTPKVFSFPDTTKQVQCHILDTLNVLPRTYNLYIADRGRSVKNIIFSPDSVFGVSREKFANHARDTNQVWATCTFIHNGIESSYCPASFVVWTAVTDTTVSPPPQPPPAGALEVYTAAEQDITKDWIHNDSGVCGVNIDGNPAQWGWNEGNKSLVKFYKTFPMSGHYAITLNSCAWPKGAGQVWIEIEGIRKYVEPPYDRFGMTSAAFNTAAGNHAIYICSDGMNHILSGINIQRIEVPKPPMRIMFGKF